MSSARCRSKACVQCQGLAALGHVKKDPESIWAGSSSELTISELGRLSSQGLPHSSAGLGHLWSVWTQNLFFRQGGGERGWNCALAQDWQVLAEHLTRPWLLAVGRRRQARCCLGWLDLGRDAECGSGLPLPDSSGLDPCRGSVASPALGLSNCLCLACSLCPSHALYPAVECTPTSSTGFPCPIWHPRYPCMPSKQSASAQEQLSWFSAVNIPGG